MTEITQKTVIIGSGPAGYTAAIYAARAGLHPLVIEGETPGGLLTTTTEVENFPGFAKGTLGPTLMEEMKKQAARFETKYLSSKVKNVDLSSRPFKILCENKEQFLTETLIISTGSSPKYLGLSHEQELIGRGVSACATCDGFFYKDKIVHVVGGGDTAMEEALFLTKFARQVTIVHRRNKLRASKPMQQRAFNNPKIDFVWDSSVDELLYDEQGVTGLILKNLKTNKKTKRETHGFFLGIGHTPNTKFLEGQLETDKNGYLITKDKHPDTSIPGVFACGDVQDHYYRQAVTAAGSGCMAAIRAEHFLEKEKSPT